LGAKGAKTPKHGYTVFGVLDDLPPGHQRFFLRKDLAPA
jgi:hypothetical protein